jgi:hypothetical protein
MQQPQKAAPTLSGMKEVLNSPARTQPPGRIGSRRAMRRGGTMPEFRRVFVLPPIVLTSSLESSLGVPQ